MNYIDKSFYSLTTYLKTLNYQEIFLNIKDSYLRLPENIKIVLEDFFRKFDYWGKLNYKEDEFEEIERRTNTIYYHLDDIIWLYEKLGDYRSKKILYAILSNWYSYDFSELRECYDNQYPDYFDLDLISFGEDEVLVDLGAYTGDSILEYLKMYNFTYKKIYGYEITDQAFSLLQENLGKYPDIVFCKRAVSDKSGIMYLDENDYGLMDANRVSLSGDKEIPVVTIDEDIKENITMIKMDIEGSEYQALMGCLEHIQNDKPKLLISVYHHHEDIWKIPRLIERLKPGYHFYLRYHGNHLFPTEVTLIAIYEE